MRQKWRIKAKKILYTIAELFIILDAPSPHIKRESLHAVPSHAYFLRFLGVFVPQYRLIAAIDPEIKYSVARSATAFAIAKIMNHRLAFP